MIRHHAVQFAKYDAVRYYGRMLPHSTGIIRFFTKQIATDDFLKNIVGPRILCLHICFLIRGIRWKTNCVGPLGPRWRKSNMAAMK